MRSVNRTTRLLQVPPALILPLVVCLLLVPVLAAPSAIDHEVQHSHHKAATHSSPLCAWFCGVAQGYEISESGFIPVLSVQNVQVVQSDLSIDDLKRLRGSSRSPPSGSF
jgi:hypothetical protein